MIPVIRVFLSSPGDVNDERQIAIKYMEWLANFRPFRNRMHLQIIAWDDPRYSTVMRASLTPQEAINRGLARPSQCDIVVVIFWSRMGTPFTHTDGVEYQSGTHWELLDALSSSETHTVIYRRTEKRLFEDDDDEGRTQYRRVKNFFASDLFYKDGKIVRAVREYATPGDFETLFEENFVELIENILNNKAKTDAIIQRTQHHPPSADATLITPVQWDKSRSPFPGLRPFSPSDADIFFGRTRETDELVGLVAKSRFVAVTGASGSGKSSLVAAGLIPRLLNNAILDPNTNTSSQCWRYAMMKPSGDDNLPNNPFASLYEALISDTAFPDSKPNIAEKRRIKRNFLDETPESAYDVITDGLKKYPNSELLLFIDQFEELFTNSDDASRERFMTFLQNIQGRTNVRVVITMRSDFFPRCADFPDLARLINMGNYLVSIPSREALRDMIERPAGRAGVIFEDGLVSQILDDTLHGDKNVKGALALMAYALDELYKIASARGDDHITFADYRALGGVAGAIGNRAEQAFNRLFPHADDDAKKRLFQAVFHQLVVVDEDGTPTRKYWTLSPAQLPDDQRALIDTFIEARLLVYDSRDGGQVTLEVAHEALFRNWAMLATWIAEAQEDLILLRQVRSAALDWHNKGRPDFLRWNHERLKLVYDMLERQNLDLNATEEDFIEPESERLLRELQNITTTHHRRAWIGDRLADIGDPRPNIGVLPNGVPDIAWCFVEKGGQITIEGHTFIIKPFYVAKYLTTHAQYQAFVDAPDGYEDPRWWAKFPREYRPQVLNKARNSRPNAPRDAISWYQSVAFAMWLDHQYRRHGLFQSVLGINPDDWQITLPPEWYWQWMAQNGDEKREYPWGHWDEYPRANTIEAGINVRSTSVGMYPHGEVACGALDVAGNLWEWCLNDYKDVQVLNGYSNHEGKVLRGGSFDDDRLSARAVRRYYNGPSNVYSRFGCRFFVVPIRL